MASSGKDQMKKPKGGPSGVPDPLSFRGLILWFLLFTLVVVAFQVWQQQQKPYDEISVYPEFESMVTNGLVKKCEVRIDGVGRQTLFCERVSSGKGKDKDKELRGVKISLTENDKVTELLRKNGIEYKNIYSNTMLSDLLLGSLPFLLLFVVLYFVFIRPMRSAGGGVMGFGRSRAKLLTRGDNKITFENVAGIDEAKEEVQEIIEFLKDAKRFQKLGGRIPKGVLLMGPPGTGKTLLAKAIAGEANVPFFSISGSDFVEMFVGVGASRVRDMFEQGKKSAPCLIFIDEIDAVGRSRFTGIGGGHDEREQTLNALLVEMDGFESSAGVIIIAATNRPDVLDPALLRPGRFDRTIVIDLPMLEGREAILKMHGKKIKLAADADLRRIARGTPGFSGADLANLLNEAALLAAKNGKEGVELKDLEEARDKVRWGRERRSRVLDDGDKKITAHHEAGHALVTMLVEQSEPVHKITIIPRGTAYLGATMQLPMKDRYMDGKVKLLGILATLMGGRVAEEMVFGDITTGARSDLKEATRVARLMICDWGMSIDMGPQTFGEPEELMFLGREVTRHKDYSEETARKIDAEINALLREAYERAKKILVENREKLEDIARLLLERETLDGEEVMEIVKHGRILSEDERKARDGQDAAKGSKPPAVPEQPGLLPGLGNL
ncbi:MAG: ATP-dependent zinc metalloprotease FtsH [bacterium]